MEKLKAMALASSTINCDSLRAREAAQISIHGSAPIRRCRPARSELPDTSIHFHIPPTTSVLYFSSLYLAGPSAFSRERLSGQTKVMNGIGYQMSRPSLQVLLGMLRQGMHDETSQTHTMLGLLSTYSRRPLTYTWPAYRSSAPRCSVSLAH